MCAKILIVEDSATVAASFAAALTAVGHEVRVATDGRAALEAMRAEKPDLLLLDAILPQMNGLELCRTLRADADFARLPIIIVSAMDRESDRYWGLKQGADEYLVKPVDPGLLVEKVNGYLTGT